MRKLKFPLLADTDKAVAGLYGTLGPLGFARRSVFIIDRDGVIRYAHRAIAVDDGEAGDVVAPHELDGFAQRDVGVHHHRVHHHARLGLLDPGPRAPAARSTGCGG